MYSNNTVLDLMHIDDLFISNKAAEIKEGPQLSQIQTIEKYKHWFRRLNRVRRSFVPIYVQPETIKKAA
ncbi:MAG: hypothetical protein JWL92_447 [Candidatus Nomurabacteria bacterium]|nr:hypothetical protein [Candidatus Nomurabacteria bacterium]